MMYDVLIVVCWCVVCGLMFVDNRMLFAVWWSLWVDCCLLCVECYVLRVVYRLLLVACCQVFAASVLRVVCYMIAM